MKTEEDKNKMRGDKKKPLSKIW
jgi:hypothetical protein